MDDILKIITLAHVGLIFNLVGTIFVAFSFGKNPGEANQEDETGRIIYLASFLYPGLFRCGLALMGVGFILQLLA
ncbi:MAG: hypothetical protein HZA01_05455 [Nitrospinae bacterium]|nr:hypothetical protein [Nitrospinota bacterium]